VACGHRPGLRGIGSASSSADPGSVLGHKRNRSPGIEECDWEYRASFTAPQSLLAEEVVELVAMGSTRWPPVVLNGREIARTDNMFIGYPGR